MKFFKTDEKKFSKRERIFYTILTLFALACVLLNTNGGRAVTAAVTKRELPIYCVDTDEKKLAISFDAAWGNEDTEKLISIMDEYGIKATFFVVGDWVRKYPESVKQLHDAGHEIMSHSDKHKHMSQLSVEDIKSDIIACQEEIEKVTGVKPFLFRPPYGEYDNKVITTLRDLGYHSIQWDVETPVARINKSRMALFFYLFVFFLLFRKYLSPKTLQKSLIPLLSFLEALFPAVYIFNLHKDTSLSSSGYPYADFSAKLQ